MNYRIHVIPIGGKEPMHWVSPRCWCHPWADAWFGGQLIVHNSKDLRDVRERTGLPKRPGEEWARVLQPTDED